MSTYRIKKHGPITLLNYTYLMYEVQQKCLRRKIFRWLFFTKTTWKEVSDGSHATRMGAITHKKQLENSS